MEQAPSRNPQKIFNRKWWRCVGVFAALGLSVTWAIYLIGLSPAGFRWEESAVGLLIVVCPPIIGTMGMDHATHKQVLEFYATLSLVNAILYGIAGMFVATAIEGFTRSRSSSKSYKAGH